MKRLLSGLLTVVLLLGLLPGVCLAASHGDMEHFKPNGTYRSSPFKDVKAGIWYEEGVATAYELGLVKGDDVGNYNPSVALTVRDAVTLAARLHRIYHTGKDDFVQGNPWYQVYIDYAVENGIVREDEFENYKATATRAQMAHIFAGALPADELPAINRVTVLPDVGGHDRYADDIFLLYRAGILTGNDAAGTFEPEGKFTRAQAATLIARMALPEQRKTFVLKTQTGELSDAIQPLEVVREPVAPETVGTLEAYSNHYSGNSLNISEDLSHSLGLAYSLTFSDATKFSELPAGFDPKELIEWGKYPGLNVDILHKYGFTGKGAVIAYADQVLTDHEQYADGNVHYTSNAGGGSSMHGPTVLSMLAGKDIGTAPEAEVYYYAHKSAIDQANLAECLYQIIEQNKTLPEGKKITMVGFSNNIFPEDQRPNEQMLRDAVAACQAAGIMVWFCGEYSTATIMPLSDKNDLDNLTYNPLYCNRNVELVFVPASGRTGATNLSGGKYIYWGASGGVSWTMPLVLGIYAIVNEIDPSLTQDDLRKMIVDTAYVNSAGMPIINPVGFVAAALKGVGRNAEAQAMLDEVAARQKYIYAIMDTAVLSEEDLTAVGSYLASLTEGTVLVVDASSFSNAQELYTALQADAAVRGGTVAGVQIFGTPDMVPAFRVHYKVQMPTAVDEGGYFLTDLFYGNFSNDAEVIAKNYNVMDHFAESWNVDLVPDWPVARLPLEKGEFTAFFEKYEDFVLDTGLERPDLVNFSNPIFANEKHTDDMGTFLKRMDNEFGMLNVDYRLYGNLDGQYPVSNTVLGGFTKENVAKENDAGIMELLVNTHGQWNNIDQCIYENNKEVRISFLNMDDINLVLDNNCYYLDAWTCLNGYGMDDNLTTTALNGQCVGMFSATTTISNNGAKNYASLAELRNSNFYYFYYNYLKALYEGQTRSQAFFAAQKAYGDALMECSTRPLDGHRNYQFNLTNLLAYHNFGVLEPNVGAMALHDCQGYITQAGQSVPKDTAQQGKPSGGGTAAQFVLTDGKPVGTAKSLQWTDSNMLQSGTYTIHSYTAQELDNGYIRFTLEYTAPEGLRMVVFNPPNGDLFKLFGANATGQRESQSFDLKAEDVRAVDTLNVSFSSSDNNRFFVFIRTSGL